MNIHIVSFTLQMPEVSSLYTLIYFHAQNGSFHKKKSSQFFICIFQKFTDSSENLLWVKSRTEDSFLHIIMYDNYRVSDFPRLPGKICQSLVDHLQDCMKRY